MSVETNLSVVQSMVKLMEKDNPEGFEKFFATNWVNHDPSLPPMQGLEGARKLFGLWSGALSNRKVTLESTLAQGDEVAVHFWIAGTHTGELMGIKPTGKMVNVSATGIFKLANGKLTDNWVNFDALGLLQQIGALPKM